MKLKLLRGTRASKILCYIVKSNIKDILKPYLHVAFAFVSNIKNSFNGNIVFSLKVCIFRNGTVKIKKSKRRRYV